MCCFLSCCVWAFDFLQRVVTVVLGALMCCMVCLGVITAVAAGVAYGYNYSMSEFLTYKRQNTTVYMRRGTFRHGKDFMRDMPIPNRRDLSVNRPLANGVIPVNPYYKIGQVLRTQDTPNSLDSGINSITKQPILRYLPVTYKGTDTTKNMFLIQRNNLILHDTTSVTFPKPTRRDQDYQEIMIELTRSTLVDKDSARTTRQKENLLTGPIGTRKLPLKNNPSILSQTLPTRTAQVVEESKSARTTNLQVKNIDLPTKKLPLKYKPSTISQTLPTRTARVDKETAYARNTKLQGYEENFELVTNPKRNMPLKNKPFTIGQTLPTRTAQVDEESASAKITNLQEEYLDLLTNPRSKLPLKYKPSTISQTLPTRTAQVHEESASAKTTNIQEEYLDLLTNPRSKLPLKYKPSTISQTLLSRTAQLYEESASARNINLQGNEEDFNLLTNPTSNMPLKYKAFTIAQTLPSRTAQVDEESAFARNINLQEDEEDFDLLADATNNMPLKNKPFSIDQTLPSRTAQIYEESASARTIHLQEDEEDIDILTDATSKQSQMLFITRTFQVDKDSASTTSLQEEEDFDLLVDPTNKLHLKNNPSIIKTLLDKIKMKTNKDIFESEPAAKSSVLDSNREQMPHLGEPSPNFSKQLLSSVQPIINRISQRRTYGMPFWKTAPTPREDDDEYQDEDEEQDFTPV